MYGDFLKIGQPHMQPRIQSSDDGLNSDLKRLREENFKLKDISMIRREVANTMIINHFKKLVVKLGQVWDAYNVYKPLA